MKVDKQSIDEEELWEVKIRPEGDRKVTPWATV